jgi:hypothetical protein
VSPIFAATQFKRLPAGFLGGARGSAILSVLLIAVGLKELRSDSAPVKDVHPLTLVVSGLSIGLFAVAKAFDQRSLSTPLLLLGAATFILAAVVQILFWLKMLPQVFWTPYQRVQNEERRAGSKLPRNSKKPD